MKHFTSVVVNLLCILLFGMVLTIGCSKNSTEPPSKVTGNVTRVYTEAELNQLIVPGMSMADVTNKFGIPGSETQLNENTVLLMYSFPMETVLREKLHLIGFDVTIRSGKVMMWNPTMGETVKTPKAGVREVSFGELAFRMYLLSDSLTNMINALESQGSVDASNLNDAPVLTFNAHVSASPNGNGGSGMQTIIVSVSDQDAVKLRDLSENNFGKRLLIVCRDKAIAAPKITDSLGQHLLLRVRSLEWLTNR